MGPTLESLDNELTNPKFAPSVQEAHIRKIVRQEMKTALREFAEIGKDAAGDLAASLVQSFIANSSAKIGDRVDAAIRTAIDAFPEESPPTNPPS